MMLLGLSGPRTTLPTAAQVAPNPAPIGGASTTIPPGPAETTSERQPYNLCVARTQALASLKAAAASGDAFKVLLSLLLFRHSNCE
jgi:hypothetical protein